MAMHTIWAMRFRKILFLLLFFFCWVCTLGAQTYVGLSAGAGLTAQMGLRTAIQTEFFLSNNVSIQTELSYLQRGNKETIRKLPSDRDYRLVNMNYISVPILLKIHLDWQPVAIYAVLGPELSQGLSTSANFVESGNIFREKLSFEQVNLRSMDMGLTLGLGLEKNIRSQKKIFLDFRYYLGLKDLDKENDSDLFHEGKFINLGIAFPL